MDFESEQFFTCPYCGQTISMLLEELYGAQIYVEDCEVCCNPIQISYEINDDASINLEVQKA